MREVKVFLDEWEAFAVAVPRSHYAVWRKLRAAINDVVWAAMPVWLRDRFQLSPPAITLRRY